ncbi:hypothetical protein [Arsenophonus sp. PmNCSU2021_1]
MRNSCYIQVFTTVPRKTLRTFIFSQLPHSRGILLAALEEMGQFRFMPV